MYVRGKWAVMKYYPVIDGTIIARVIGIPDRPVIIRDYTDEEADILVADYNITREDLLPVKKPGHIN